MAQPPTGTVTLVFTDIQGSTALWEHFGEEFKGLLMFGLLFLRMARLTEPCASPVGGGGYLSRVNMTPLIGPIR